MAVRKWEVTVQKEKKLGNFIVRGTVRKTRFPAMGDLQSKKTDLLRTV